VLLNWLNFGTSNVGGKYKPSSETLSFSLNYLAYSPSFVSTESSID